MQRPLAQLILAALLAVASPLALFAADDHSGTYTTQEEAPPSYKLQGEYVGEVTVDGEKVKHGVQVIALGHDKFEAVVYPGGLPGDGYSGGNYDDLLKFEGTSKDGKVEFKGDRFIGTLTPEKIEVVSDSGDKIGTMKKVVRKSPTEGAKAPKSAIVLFDGTSAEAFDNGKIVQGDLLLADCSSKQKFGDHSLHLEFRTPFKPDARGQGRGNSGMYVQSRYEVQVLDSFGLSGADNECGGIYKVARPKVNMCYPPLTWQTYDVDFTAAKYDESGKKTQDAKITVKQNGVVIHEDLDIPHNTPGRHGEGPEKDSLYLQGHGNPVVYRNIWVVEK